MPRLPTKVRRDIRIGIQMQEGGRVRVQERRIRRMGFIHRPIRIIREQMRVQPELSERDE
jgi:hypothetical protein